MVAAYTSANTYLFDLETSKQVTTLETKQNTGNNHRIFSLKLQINIHVHNIILKLTNWLIYIVMLLENIYGGVVSVCSAFVPGP